MNSKFVVRNSNSRRGKKIGKLRKDDNDGSVNSLPANPFKPNGIFHRYQLKHYISDLRDVAWYFSFLFKY